MWIRDLGVVSNKGWLGKSFLGQKKFSWSNSNFTVLTPTFFKDEYLNSYFQNPRESSEI